MGNIKQRRWVVVFEDDNKRLVFHVDAVGYSQAITFAGDELVRGGKKREDWEPIRVDSIYATTPSREQLRDMEEAHAEGLHDEIPRQFCPECEAQGRRA